MKESEGKNLVPQGKRDSKRKQLPLPHSFCHTNFALNSFIHVPYFFECPALQ